MYCLPGARFIDEKFISNLISVVIQLFPVKDKFSLKGTMAFSWFWLVLKPFELSACNIQFFLVQGHARGVQKIYKPQKHSFAFIGKISKLKN